MKNKTYTGIHKNTHISFTPQQGAEILTTMSNMILIESQSSGPLTSRQSNKYTELLTVYLTPHMVRCYGNK